MRVLYQVGIYPDDNGIPLEILLLHAAGGDPLRAQEMEEKLAPDWWAWYLTDMSAKAQAKK